MSVLFRLYIAFLQVGTFAFGGGYAILPMIQKVIVEQYQWLTMQEMTDIISISQMTPGPISINSATFVGTKLAGLPGAITATVGSVTPQFFLMLTLAHFYFSNRQFTFMDKILRGIKPGIVGLILIAAISMTQESLFTDGVVALDQLNIIALICFVVGLILYIKKVDLIKLIFLGAVMGISLSLIL